MSIWDRHPGAAKKALELKATQSWKETAERLSAHYGELFTINQVRDKIKRRIHKKPNAEIRRGIISDVHIPQEIPLFIETIEPHLRGKVDELIVAGDWFDQYCLSKFPKHKALLIRQELETGYQYLKTMASWCPVTLITGNHDERLQNILADKLDPEIQFLFDRSLLRRYETGFEIPNDITGEVKRDPPVRNITVIPEWWTQVGDLIVAHPKNFSSVDLRTAINTHNWFLSRGHNYSVLLIGHTHKAGVIFKDCRWTIGELGCLCRDMDYAEKTGRLNTRPQQRTITILTQTNGVTTGMEQILLRGMDAQVVKYSIIGV